MQYKKDFKNYNVVLLDEFGKPTGVKPRADLYKDKDIVHTIHLMGVTTNKEIILALIPSPEQVGRLNIFGGMLGNVAASILREGESNSDAARRALSEELFLPADTRVKLLGESFDVMEGDIKRLHTTYYYIHHGKNICFNREDAAGLVLLQRHELEERIEKQPEIFAESFLIMWKRYNHVLPL